MLHDKNSLWSLKLWLGPLFGNYCSSSTSNNNHYFGSSGELNTINLRLEGYFSKRTERKTTLKKINNSQL